MEWGILLIASLIVSAIQVAVPFVVKRTVVFGVTIPMEQTTNKSVVQSKKVYALITGVVSTAGLLTFLLWSIQTNPSETQLALVGMILPIFIIVTSLALYFYFHVKMSKLKREENWFEGKKRVKVADLAIRTRDEMLPWYVFALPVFVTIGLIIFTAMNYSQFPGQIPIHWGADGKPDAYTDKTVLSVFSLPIILLVLQGMFLGIIELTKQSGIKVRPTQKNASRKRQLNLRKYTSWLLLLVSILLTMMFSFLQVITLYGNPFSDSILMMVPLLVMFLTLGGAVVYAIKIGKIDSDLDHMVIEEDGGEEEYDDDQYWIGGMIYFNKQDPSVMVEKRFGIGMTVNFARPLAYVIFIVPLFIILLLSFL